MRSEDLVATVIEIIREADKCPVCGIPIEEDDAPALCVSSAEIETGTPIRQAVEVSCWDCANWAAAEVSDAPTTFIAPGSDEVH